MPLSRTTSTKSGPADRRPPWRGQGWLNPTKRATLSLARRLATLFSSYAVQRPEMLRAWSAEEATDGYAPLAADLEWQPYLWREVTARVSEPAPDQQLATTLERLRSNDTGHLNLPDRLSLFGHTRLARSELALLEALGQHRDIHLWLPQTSTTLWDKLAPLVADGVVYRTADDTASHASNPILSAFGRDTRELQRSLAGIEYLDSPVDVPAPAPQSMLSWLQADIRADREATRAEVADRDVSAQDRSVQVHSCHGPARQVEVLRDVLAGLLEDDPTLEPRDILVMCPRVDDYAPLIQAQFGMLDVPGAARKGHPAHQFRVRLADRGARHTNPLLSFVIELLSLADSRVTASQVKSLMAAPPVQARFSFDEDSVTWQVSGLRLPALSGDLMPTTWTSSRSRTTTRTVGNVAWSGSSPASRWTLSTVDTCLRSRRWSGWAAATSTWSVG
ncbi:exodeoxyribonuclease V subunit gamma [Ornithinimicrobium sp. INDO-MA30-4]|uniref:exodeoxyribonuclease V subunit gamma n=1 Tax=Ornithinimicrobium sp. INDO-MA30-4 TaxID=2908651 RepID=UPI00288306B8|nr:exodeoxyribonuclease V subunit gamma [Ornithinimicrobium sp. INDO-MA30-4]